MAHVRWTDPFGEFAQWQHSLSRALSDRAGQAWVPPVDIYQNGAKEVVIKTEVPGMSRADIEITVDNGVLTLKGEKKLAADLKDEQFHRVERRYGSFSRAFSLPDTVDAAKVTADYKDGVLTIALPMREEAKPRHIKVEIAA